MVFLAKQAARESSLHVAIKYVPKQTIYESKGISRMQQEMNALQICDHPFIAHCFGGFEVNLKRCSVIHNTRLEIVRRCTASPFGCVDNPIFHHTFISLYHTDTNLCGHRVGLLLWWRAVPPAANSAQNDRTRSKVLLLRNRLRIALPAR